MPTLDWNCRTADGVTLVEALVTADGDRRVRVENCLDGPVWPPRSDGVPEAGWDEEGFAGRVGPDSPLVLGYASPASPADPPVRLAEVGEPRSGDVTPEDAVRALGTGAPPRDAMPGSDAASDDASDEGGVAGGGTDERSTAERATGSRNRERTGADASTCPVDAWFAAVEERLSAAEELTAASSVEEARTAVEEAGGMAAVRDLRAQISRDRERLAQVERRCSEARERAEAVEVPVGTLARLG